MSDATVDYFGTPLRGTKGHRTGTHREVAPAETLERIRPAFAAMGLTRLADVTGLDRVGIPVVLSVRPNSASLAVDAGKGVTAEAATVSAAMESLERWAAERPREPALRARWRDAGAGDDIVLPPEAYGTVRHGIFDPDERLAWCLAWDLSQREAVLVPDDMVGLRRNQLPRDRVAPFPIGTNGLASGNSMVEAVCAGLLELIERDAIALWQAVQDAEAAVPPRIDALSLKDPTVCGLVDRLEASGIGLSLRDCTVDTNVPVYQALLWDRSTRHTGIYRGSGAHLDPAVAQARAVTEAVQSRVIYVAGSRDDFLRHDMLRLRMADRSDLVASLERQPISHGRAAPPTHDRFEEDIRYLLNGLRRVGLDRVLVVALPFDGADLAVVRVICPGLEGYLYDFYQPGPRARAFLEALDP